MAGELLHPVGSDPMIDGINYWYKLSIKWADIMSKYSIITSFQHLINFLKLTGKLEEFKRNVNEYGGTVRTLSLIDYVSTALGIGASPEELILFAFPWDSDNTTDWEAVNTAWKDHLLQYSLSAQAQEQKYKSIW